jgi:hypothetical protein
MSAAVDDTVKGGMNEIQDLPIGSGMPILFGVWDVLQQRYSFFQPLLNISGKQAVGVPYGVKWAPL